VGVSEPKSGYRRRRRQSQPVFAVDDQPQSESLWPSLASFPIVSGSLLRGPDVRTRSVASNLKRLPKLLDAGT